MTGTAIMAASLPLSTMPDADTSFLYLIGTAIMVASLLLLCANTFILDLGNR